MSEHSLLFQLLTCNRGISQHQLKHTQTPRSSHTQNDKDMLFVFSHQYRVAMPVLRSGLHVMLKQVRSDRCLCHPLVAGPLTSGTNQIRVWLCMCVSVLIVILEHVLNTQNLNNHSDRSFYWLTDGFRHVFNYQCLN